MAIIIVTAAALALVVLSNREVRERLRRDEKGEVTEKVIITALFAALALTAATIITIKVTERAESIPTEVPAQQGGGLGG
jgi:hypothetical protein